MSKLTKLRSASYAPLGEWAYQEITTLRTQLAEAQKETKEQARMNGMGSEREAKLQANIAEVTSERDELLRAVAEHVTVRGEYYQQLLATQANAARLKEALKFLDERIITSAELSGVARAAISTPTNLDALHEDRARTLEEAAKNWIYGSTFNVLNEMAAANRAKKEGK